MKRTLYILSLFFLFVSCTKEMTAPSELTQFIPRKASAILKVDNLDDFNKAVSSNELITSFKGTRIYELVSKHQMITKGVKATGESLISFVQIGKDDVDISYVTPWHSNVFSLDSTSMTSTNVTKEIKAIKTPSGTFYAAAINDVFMTASSKLLIENALREQNTRPNTNPSFMKAYRSTSRFATASILLHGDQAAVLYDYYFPEATSNPLRETFDWMAADIDFTNNTLSLQGVVIPDGTSKQVLRHFQNTTAVRTSVDQLIPSTAISSKTITANDIVSLRKNALTLKDQTTTLLTVKDSLVNEIKQITQVTLRSGTAYAMEVSDVDTFEAIFKDKTKASSFRNVDIYALDQEEWGGFKSAFAKAYTPSITLPDIPAICYLNEHILLANDPTTLEAIVANYQNGSTLAKNPAFKASYDAMSSAASWRSISDFKSKNFLHILSPEDQKLLKDSSWDNYPFGMLQLAQDTDFLHLEAQITNSSGITVEPGVRQISSIKLNDPIAMSPQFVKNYKTKGSDIVVQDINHVLYLISNTGKVLWQKPLGSAVLGTIQQVDLYRNGRLQLAFTTADAFYILDRNGNEVAPFPIQFQDEITLPLAIYDYENNRNYRFVITQDDTVLMFDKQAKRVKGFTFEKAGSPILFPPTHVRIANKDYIVIAEQSGKLHILSRVGKERIKIEDRINFGDVPVFKDDRFFTTYDVNGNRILIDTKGTISKTETALGSSFTLSSVKGLTASLQDNRLAINNKTIKLDAGTYTAPQIFQVGKKHYVSITNTDTSQLFLYDVQGELVDHFPIYGASTSSIAFLERDKHLGVVTQGDARTILLYSL